jgi:IS5 family transposase
MPQITFASLAYQEKKKLTRRDKFLMEMDEIIPWEELEGVVAPHYPRGRKGRPPMPLRTMLRIYCMQQWFGYSDPGMEEALYEIMSIQRFAGLELGRDAVPDETTILHFRHLLEKHNLTAEIFSVVNQHLANKGLIVRGGTITDATIIHAPSSTKNKKGERDQEMSSTKKGNQWYFGMKAHVGAHSKNGLVHTVICTNAKVHDSKVMEDLLHGEETEIYGDKAYADNAKKAKYSARGIAWRVAIKAPRGQKLSERDKSWNRSRSRKRALVEHAFGVIKNLWGYTKVRYRGIHKNHCQLLALFALSNLYRTRHRLQKLRHCPL